MREEEDWLIVRGGSRFGLLYHTNLAIALQGRRSEQSCLVTQISRTLLLGILHVAIGGEKTTVYCAKSPSGQSGWAVPVEP